MAYIITSIEEALGYNVKDIQIDEYWNLGDSIEPKIHSIHSYPAKFPAFIATKAISYAKNHGIYINKIADVFCGCGTVALEAKNNNFEFWGCDINPIATLIAKVKSSNYNSLLLESYYKNILSSYHNLNKNTMQYKSANQRLRYWFDEEHFLDLKRLLNAIQITPNGKYRQAFNCIFSSILKPTSKWLTKSIKPQIDQEKCPIDVETAFKNQFNLFLKAINDNDNIYEPKMKIETVNFLTKRVLPTVSLIITSPPYVTSYEYADLHQLSSLWLGYTDDYRDLRNGTIGSIHNHEQYYFEVMELNNTAAAIIEQMRQQKISNSKVKSVARYYIDIQRATQRCYHMLEDNGIAFFIIGDTEYKGVKIENSRHLVESLIMSGFSEISLCKRRISKKLLTPYRDEKGKFTNDKTKRSVYHEEFVVMGFKNKNTEERDVS